MKKFTPNNYGHLIPDQDGAWMRVSEHEAIVKVMRAEAVINTRTAAEVIEACAKSADPLHENCHCTACVFRREISANIRNLSPIAKEEN